ncbi:MAG: DUF4114 domain-containing protein [Spirulina sp.]
MSNLDTGSPDVTVPFPLSMADLPGANPGLGLEPRHDLPGGSEGAWWATEAAVIVPSQVSPVALGEGVLADFVNSFSWLSPLEGQTDDQGLAWGLSAAEALGQSQLTIPAGLAPAVDAAITHLAQFRQTDTWATDLTLAFGDEWEVGHAEHWLDSLLQASAWPTITLLPLADLKAYGAYAPDLDRLFLAQEVVDSPALHSLAVDVLLEEVGHWLDHRLNPTDSPGDEGERFSALVQQRVLPPSEIAPIQAENDWATLVWQGQTWAVEQSAAPGIFTVGASGQVNVEFLFDSGAYQGEVGIFSLTGLETLAPGSPEFIAAAVQRALSNSSQGRVVISTAGEGASLSGELGERNYNAGTSLGPKSFAFQPNDTLALILVPNGTFQAVASNPAVEGNLRPLFSLAAANPLGRDHYGAMTTNANGLVLGLEDLRFDGNSDADFNDVILKIEGITGQLPALDSLVQSRQTWLTSPLGRDLFSITPINPVDPSDPGTPDPPGTPLPPVAPLPPTPGLTVAINSEVVKFSPGVTEAQLIASGAARISLGSQTLYIGTDQVSAINQNPILASFDAVNPANNWIRADYEATGADGRGNGLAVTPSGEVYAFFSVDGTQGTPDQDFRRASTAAEQAWLRSYGQGGGPKVSVIGKIDPATGSLVAAAYLSAILSNGNSNSLTITGLAVQPNGNLRISAQSFFAPRQPNGQAMILDSDPTTPDTSPFPYFIEITPDLRRVVSTAAVGWI